MARSTYIYVAVWAERVGVPMLVAARTVKRELVGCLAEYPAAALEDMDVWRMPDGDPRGPNDRIHLGTGAEFLAKERP